MSDHTAGRPPKSCIQTEPIFGGGDGVVGFPCSYGHSLLPPGLIGRLGYGGKMSDLIVAVLQLPCRSSRNSPAEPLAVGPGAFGGGIFKQAFSNQLPHTNQVPISDLYRRNKMKVERNTERCGNTGVPVLYPDGDKFPHNTEQYLGSNQRK